MGRERVSSWSGRAQCTRADEVRREKVGEEVSLEMSNLQVRKADSTRSRVSADRQPACIE